MERDMPSQLNLLPQPRSVQLMGGSLDLYAGFIALGTDPAAPLRPAGLSAQEALKRYAGLDCEIVGGANSTALLTISLGEGHTEGYRLSITAGGLNIVGNDPAG